MLRQELGGVFSVEVIEEHDGKLIVKASGKGAKAFFEGESGGHRWQRVPPNEKKGRVQTSTVTIAVLHEQDALLEKIKYEDVEFEAFRSGGPGGQNVNKVSSAVRATHIPTGITTECRDSRDQWKNKQKALEKLQDMLNRSRSEAAIAASNSLRKQQIGSGMRGDKIRTYRVKDDIVVDHKYGNETRLTKLLRGDWDDLKSSVSVA